MLIVAALPSRPSLAQVSSQKYSSEVLELLNEAGQLFNSGQYSSALRTYSKIQGLEPNCEAAYNGAGLCYYRLNNPVKAEQSYQSALNVNPGYYLSLFNLGNLKYYQERYAESVQFFKKAESVLKSPDADLFCMLANVYRDKSSQEANPSLRRLDAEQALSYYQKALKVNTRLETAHANLGRLYVDMGNPSRAEASYRTAVELKPDYAFAYFELGQLLGSQGRRPEALVSFWQSLQFETIPTYRAQTIKSMIEWPAKASGAAGSRCEVKLSEPICDQLAQGYTSLAKENFAAAESAFASVASLSEAMRATAWNNIGYARQKQRKYRDAIQAYQEAITCSPSGFAEASYNLGHCYLVLKQFPEAERAFQRAVQLQGRNCLAHIGLGIALANQGKFPEAERHYNLVPLLARPYSVPVVNFNRAVLFERQGKADQAASEYRRYLADAPAGVNAATARERLKKLGRGG